jgi:hypothetical protein
MIQKKYQNPIILIVKCYPFSNIKEIRENQLRKNLVERKKTKYNQRFTQLTGMKKKIEKKVN